MKQNRKRKETAGMNFLLYLGRTLSRSVLSTETGHPALPPDRVGYELLWMVTLSTIMLIFAAQCGASRHCHGESASPEAAGFYLPAWLKNTILATALMAAVATAITRDPRQCDCTPDAVRHSRSKLGSADDSRAGSDLPSGLRSASRKRIEKLIIVFVS